MWRALSRAEALHEIEALTRDALGRIVHERGLAVADLTLLSRSGENDSWEEGPEALVTGSTVTVSGARRPGRQQLAQLWRLLAEIHCTLTAGKKLTQRELWYRLKSRAPGL